MRYLSFSLGTNEKKRAEKNADSNNNGMGCEAMVTMQINIYNAPIFFFR